jgi:hypothetical protein
MISSGLWRRLDSLVDANVLEKHTVSIFRAEEMLASTEESTRRQNPEEHHHRHCRENLKPFIDFVSLLG